MPATASTSPAHHALWRMVQSLVLGTGIFMVAMLLFQPELGLYLLWDVLIPVAPVLLVVAPGVWRNVCPLGTFSLLPARFKFSKQRRLSRRTQSIFFGISVLLLLVIVPARHVVLDQYGVVTGIVLVAVAALAFALGMVFDWKSAWCSGLCPVYPVEMLYGTKPIVRVPNVQCTTCTGCVSPCRDSKIATMPRDVDRTNFRGVMSGLFVGGFPGFVLGWYLVPPNLEIASLSSWITAYAYPFAGFGLSVLVYFVVIFRLRRRVADLLFATIAVCVYYWFKLPVVFGLSGDVRHALIDLSQHAAPWAIWVVRVVGVVGLAALLLARGKRLAWSTRPPVAKPARA